MKLLEHPGDAGHDGGPHARKVSRDGLQRLGEADPAAEQQKEVERQPLEDVAEREERHRLVVPADLHDRVHRHQVREDVPVREHHALGVARRARGVNDGGDVLRAQAPGPLLVLTRQRRVGADARATLLHDRLQGVHGRAAGRGSGDPLRRRDHDHGREVGQLRRQPEQLGELDVVGHHHDLDAGVAEDELGLRRGQRRVDGNVDGAGGQDRKVGNGPFRAALADQPHAVAALDAEPAQTEAQGPDLLHELAGRKLPEAVGLAAPDEHGPVEPLRQEERKFGQRGDRGVGGFGDSHARRMFTLNHFQPSVNVRMTGPRPFDRPECPSGQHSARLSTMFATASRARAPRLTCRAATCRTGRPASPSA